MKPEFFMAVITLFMGLIQIADGRYNAAAGFWIAAAIFNHTGVSKKYER